MNEDASLGCLPPSFFKMRLEMPKQKSGNHVRIHLLAIYYPCLSIMAWFPR